MHMSIHLNNIVLANVLKLNQLILRNFDVYKKLNFLNCLKYLINYVITYLQKILI